MQIKSALDPKFWRDYYNNKTDFYIKWIFLFLTSVWLNFPSLFYVILVVMFLHTAHICYSHNDGGVWEMHR